MADADGGIENSRLLVPVAWHLSWARARIDLTCSSLQSGRAAGRQQGAIRPPPRTRLAGWGPALFFSAAREAPAPPRPNMPCRPGRFLQQITAPRHEIIFSFLLRPSLNQITLQCTRCTD
jgi:hypothetical protein